MMINNLSFELIGGMSWRQDSDYTPLSLEACMYSEGRVFFVNEDKVEGIALYLLELQLELKTVLVKSFGSSSYQEDLSLLLSSTRLRIIRQENDVQIQQGGRMIMRRDWESFARDFGDFQDRLAAEIRRHFPLMAASSEFKIVF